MPDHRRKYRKRSFLAAYAGLGEGPSMTPCLVRDISPSGARIEFAGAESVPESFELFINGRDQVFRVHIVWRGTGEVGVRILAKRPLQHRPESGLLPIGRVPASSAPIHVDQRRPVV